MNKKYFFGAFALCVAFLGARADIIPINFSEPPEDSNFRWNYATFVTADQRVETGDYFTIYDFGIFVPGSNLQPTDWAFSSSLLGITPTLVLPEDDPNVLNLTWTYIGTTPLNGAAFLGLFSVLSATNQMRDDYFAALATRSTGPQAGTKISNIGFIGVPVPEMSALAPILGVCGLGFIGLLSSTLRRRRLA